MKDINLWDTSILEKLRGEVSTAVVIKHIFIIMSHNYNISLT